MKKPNIVFILTDDQGYWSLGSYGNKEIHTPNLDKMGENGLVFDNFFCASPVCSPARASIITGKIPSQHGVQDWIREGNVREGAIDYLDGMVAYTDILSANGWTCGLSGKWHCGNSFIPQHGFSHWYAHQKGSGNYFYAPMVRNGEAVEEPGYITDLITDDAIEFIEENAHKENPFYLSVHYTAPHNPWSADQHPQKYLDLYKDCKFEWAKQEEPHPEATFVYNAKDARESLIGYYASITAVDDNVGRLFESLEEQGILEDTLIIFTSDNGYACGQHGIWGKGNGTFSLNMYEKSIKVPTIIYRKGHIEPNQRNKDLLSHYDLFPTILDYCGINNYQDDSLPGLSFASILEGKKYKSNDSIVIFDEYGPCRMIRGKRYKYIHRYPHGPFELFDLENDPFERENLYGNPEFFDLVESMRADLYSWFLKYVDPRIDGSKEPVKGNGQICRPGIYSNGKIAFDQNRKRNTDPRVDPGTTAKEQANRVR